MALTAAWAVPQIWNGQAAFILGGGPSLRGFAFEQLCDRNLLAVNALAFDVLNIAKPTDVLFGHDGAFFLDNPELVARWPGLIVSLSQEAAGRFSNLHRIVTREVIGFTRGGCFIKRGRSSGQTAIALAIAMGASRIVLLGFDMRIVAGRSHSHDRYSHQHERLYRSDFLPRFRGWDLAARRFGVDVFNATPESALREFRMIDLPSALQLDSKGSATT